MTSKNSKEHQRLRKKSVRYSYVGLLKFLAALCIIYLHTGKGGSHWGCSWILVEFFFMLTGYFTYRHFQKDRNSINNDDIEEKSKKAIKYSIKKFTSFLPYMLVGLAVFYIALSIYESRFGLRAALMAFKTLLFDILFLNSQLPIGAWAIWFISAMAIIFPIFSLLCQTKKPKTVAAIMLPAIIYFYLQIYGDKISGLYAYGRAFFGMSAGIYICQLVDYINTLNLSKKHLILMNVVEWGATLSVVICLYPSNTGVYVSSAKMIGVVMMFIAITLTLSGKTLTSRIQNNKFLDYLEKLSMVIYLIHVGILWSVTLILEQTGTPQYLQIITIILSVTLSAILYEIVETIKRKRAIALQK